MITRILDICVAIAFSLSGCVAVLFRIWNERVNASSTGIIHNMEKQRMGSENGRSEMLAIAKTRKLRYFGHVTNHSCLEKRHSRESTRKRERPKTAPIKYNKHNTVDNMPPLHGRWRRMFQGVVNPLIKMPENKTRRSRDLNHRTTSVLICSMDLKFCNMKKFRTLLPMFFLASDFGISMCRRASVPVRHAEKKYCAKK